MKKIISAALLLALCLSLFAGCSFLFPTPEPSEDLNAAKEYLDSYMKDLPTTTSLDFNVLGVVAINGVVFPVEWTTDNAAITLERDDENGLVKVILPGCGAADVAYTLTATLSEESGATLTSTYNLTIPAADYVAAPEAGKTYKLGFLSNYDEKNPLVYYFTGKMSGYYGATSVAWSQATDVTVEAAEGGYYLTYMDKTTKKYISIKYELSSGDGNWHLNFVLTNTATTIFTFDSKLGTFATTVKIEDVDTICYLGTAGKYSTFDSIKAPDVKADTWLAHLYAKDVNPDLNANDPTADSTLTIPEANTLGASKLAGLYTSNKYYVTGVISRIEKEQYGNVYIKDANGNELYIYGINDANGKKFGELDNIPKVGDTITVYGIVGNYNKTPQMKETILTAHTAHTCDFSVAATCTEGPKCSICGTVNGEALGHKDEDNNGVCDVCTEKVAVYVPSFVASPEAGKAYKLVMQQNGVDGKPMLGITGAMSGHYWATTETVKEMVDVYLEAVEGGYQLYFMNGDAKTYLNVIQSGNYINVVFQTIADNATPSVYTLNTEFKYFYTTVGETDYYLGNYGTYTSISASKTSYIEDTSKIGTSQFCAWFCELVEDTTEPENPDQGGTENPGTDTPAQGENTTVSVTIADKGWTDSTLYAELEMDSNVTVSVSGTPVGNWGQNTGKFYSKDSTWRIYQNESPAVTVKAAEGKTIVSVKITYNIKNTGVLTYNGTNITSGTVVEVNANSITFSVGNTDSSVTNGQAQITSIEVIYK